MSADTADQLAAASSPPHLPLPASLAQLGTEAAFDVLARARALERAGREIIHLEIGEPDFPTPEHICEAAAKALRDGHTRYCPAAGLPELREAAAEYFVRSRGIDARPERVLVATGAKPFLFFSVLATCSPGDEVVYPDPGFPIYESVINWLGARPVPLALREENGFAVDADELAASLTPRTRLVILNSPHNPTGAVLGPEVISDVAAVLATTSAWVLSDEVYAQIVYDGEVFSSIASHPAMLDRVILVDSLSKTYSMTGWRCGFAHLPKRLLEPMIRFLVNSTSCVPPFVQLAGVAALTGPQDHVHSMVEEFQARRDLIVDGLNSIPGISCQEPRGAFYAFPSVSGVPLPAAELASRLLHEAGVASLSGSAFGAEGTDNLRLSYATSRDDIAAGLERIRDLVVRLCSALSEQ